MDSVNEFRGSRTMLKTGKGHNSGSYTDDVQVTVCICSLWKGSQIKNSVS